MLVGRVRFEITTFGMGGGGGGVEGWGRMVGKAGGWGGGVPRKLPFF